MTDIQCDDLRGIITQQHVTEPSGGRANIQAMQPLRRTQSCVGEPFERADQLVCAPGNVIVSPIDCDDVIAADFR